MNGLIIQWGNSTADGTNNKQVNFPISFTTDCSISITSTTSTQAYTLYIGTKDKSYFKYGRYGGDSSGNKSYWIAIGY